MYYYYKYFTQDFAEKDFRVFFYLLCFVKFLKTCSIIGLTLSYQNLTYLFSHLIGVPIKDLQLFWWAHLWKNYKLCFKPNFAIYNFKVTFILHFLYDMLKNDFMTWNYTKFMRWVRTFIYPWVPEMWDTIIFFLNSVTLYVTNCMFFFIAFWLEKPILNI